MENNLLQPADSTKYLIINNNVNSINKILVCYIIIRLITLKQF